MIKGQRNDDSPAYQENWKRPSSEEWVRTFAIITTNSNELVSAIHNRMRVISAPKDYTRWL